MVNIDDNPWFNGRDICELLELGNPSHINKLGLHKLILGSRKPRARELKRWVIHEAIPSIRRSSMYLVTDSSTSLEDLIILQANSVRELENRLE